MDYRSGGLVGRWRAEGGYREFLGIALPLILSTAIWSIQHFVVRVDESFPIPVQHPHEVQEVGGEHPRRRESRP